MNETLKNPLLNPIKFAGTTSVVQYEVQPKIPSLIRLKEGFRFATQLTVPFFPWLNSSFLVTRILIPIVKEWLGPSPYDATRSILDRWKHMNRRFTFATHDWGLFDWLWLRKEDRSMVAINGSRVCLELCESPEGVKYYRDYYKNKERRKADKEEEDPYKLVWAGYDTMYRPYYGIPNYEDKEGGVEVDISEEAHYGGSLCVRSFCVLLL
jgi:hypothetical protein